MKRNMKFVLLSAFLSAGLLSATAQDQVEKKNPNRARDKAAVNTNKPSPTKAIEAIVGTWQIESVLKGKADISETDTVDSRETFIFSRENRYVSHSGEEQIDSGMFRLNENHSILYLESETGGPPSEWDISFDGEQLSMQQRQQSDKIKPIKYVYTKKPGNEQ